jgi:hypothetical protein
MRPSAGDRHRGCRPALGPPEAGGATRRTILPPSLFRIPSPQAPTRGQGRSAVRVSMRNPRPATSCADAPGRYKGIRRRRRMLAQPKEGETPTSQLRQHRFPVGHGTFVIEYSPGANPVLGPTEHVLGIGQKDDPLAWRELANVDLAPVPVGNLL